MKKREIYELKITLEGGKALRNWKFRSHSDFNWIKTVIDKIVKREKEYIEKDKELREQK